MSRVQKALSLLGGIVVILSIGVTVLLLWLTSADGENYLKNYLSRWIKSELHIQTDIDSLSLDIFSQIRLAGLALESVEFEDTTRIEIDELRIRYDLSGLLIKRIIISAVDVSGVQLQMRTDTSGNWLLGSLLTPSDNSTGSDWSLEVQKIHIADTYVDIGDRQSGLSLIFPSVNMDVTEPESGQFQYEISVGWLDESMPEPRIAPINASGSLTNTKFIMKSFSMIHPDFDLRANLGIILSDYTWTDHSTVSFKGSPTPLLKPISTLMGVELPLPSGLFDAEILMDKLIVAPEVSFTVKCDALILNDYPRVDGILAGLVTTEQVTIDTFDVVILKTPLQGRGYFAFDSLSSFAISGKLPATPIEASLAEYYGSGDDYTGIVKGEFHGNGQLLEIQNVNMKATFDISQASWLGKPIKSTTLYASLDQGQASLSFNQGQNQLHVSASLDSLEHYQAKLTYNLPDLAPIMSYTPAVGLSGKLVGSAEVRYANESFIYKADLRGTALEYQGVHIDKTHFRVKGIDQDWTILDGEISSYQSDLAVVNRFIEAPILSGRATYQASVKGTLDQLTGNANLYIRSLQVDSLSVDSAFVSLYVEPDVIKVINVSGYLNDQRVLASGAANWRRMDADMVLLVENREDSNWLSQGSLSVQAHQSDKGSSVKLKGKSFDLSLLKYLPTDYNQFSGLLNFDLTAKLGSTLEWGKLRLNGTDITFQDQNFQSIRLSAYVDSNWIKLDTLFIEHKSERLFVAMGLPIDLHTRTIRNHSPLTANIQTNNFDLIRLQTFLPENVSISGFGNSSLSIKGNLTAPHFYGKLDLKDIQMDYPGFPQMFLENITAEFDSQSVYLKKIDLAIDSRNLAISGQADIYNPDSYFLKLDLDAGLQGKVHLSYQITSGVSAAGVQLENADMSIANYFLEAGQEIQGVANGKLGVKDLSGNRDVRGNMSVSKGLVRLSSDLPAIQDIELGVFILPNRIDIKRLKGNLDNIPFSSQGYMEHTQWDQFKIDQFIEIAGVRSLTLKGYFSTTSLDLNVEIPTMNLSAWRPLFPTLEKLSGEVRGNLFIKGSPELPQINGDIYANDLAMDLPYFDPELSQGKIVAHFQDQKIRLDSLSFRQGKNGRIFLAGEFEYFANQLPRFDMRMLASQIKLKEANVIKGQINDINLTYSGQDEKYILKGGAKLGSVSIQQRITPKDILKMASTSGKPKTSPPKILTQTKINFKIDESDQLSIQNNLAHVRLKTDLTILGTLAQPIPTGRMKIQEGYILYLDRHFEVTAATLDFQNQYELNPIVDLHAKTQLKPYQTRSKKEYTIYIDLTGPMDKADFVLRSEPALDRTDILTLLTMGATRQELSQSNPNMDNAKIGKILQDRLSDYSSQKISAYTADRIGTFMNLDNISIEGDLFNFGSSWGPELVASKKVGEKTTLTYSTSVGQATTQNVKLEYELIEGVSIEGQTDQKGRSGLDLKFGWKFK
ncbi:MAG: translocation/assembly module TamB domain-containing protein [Candidatus Marinimicrobia bacterium]|nr:translocation/assembly module TamB domain-containing protein [Candidatus Neomarinimicrobiota bacterium]